MESPQARPLSPKSVRSNSKFSQTFSRFKGIIRLPGTRKPSGNERHGTSPRQDDKGLEKGPYSPRGMALKAYMSHPTLGQLHPTTRGDSPSQPGDSDPDSSSSISPVERNYDSRLDLDPPRPSFQSQEQPDDLRAHSRAQSLHDLPHDRAQDTRRSRQAPPNNHISRTRGSPPTPATEGFKARRRSGTNPHGSSDNRILGNIVKSFDKSLQRSSSKSRIKARPEDEHPVPLIPASLQNSRQPPPELSMSTSTTSTITATPKAVTQAQGSLYTPSSRISKEDLRTSRPTNVPHRTAPSAKKSVSSFVSSSGSSFVTAESHISTESAAPTPVEKDLPMLPPAMDTRAASTASEPAGSRMSGALDDSPTTPMAKKGLPNLKMAMPTRKFSLLSSGETARLSPSLVIRAPPLPIFNLPKLSAPTSILPEDEGLQRRRSRAAGLNAMPALPRQGTGRGTAGHEEHDMDDDVDDIDEEDDMEEGDHESMDENEGPDTGFGTTSTSDLSDGRSSYDLGHPPSGGSSGSSAFSYDFKSLHQKPQLPPLNVTSSPFAIRFPGSPSTTIAQTPAGSFSLLAKGKSKLVTPLQDETQHPPRSSPVHVEGDREGKAASSLTGNNNDNRGRGSHYFDSIHGAPQRPSLLASSSSSRGHAQALRPQVTPGGSPHPSSIPPSPLQTPRAEDYRLSQHRLIPPPPPLPHSHSYSSNRDSLVNPMGGAVSAQRPSMYKHASRSLIDLHAIEKRQKVERMVREGEEEQEKEMRRKSIRRNRDSLVGNRDSLYSIRLDAQAHTAQLRKSVIEEGSAEGTEEIGKQGGHDNLDAQEGGVSIPHGSEGFGGLGKRESLAMGSSEAWKEEEKSQNRLSMAPAYDAGPHPLRKRRSMPVFNEASAPPPYPTFAPHPSARFANHTIQPRDDEGREVLPPYSNAIYLKAILPRKMEFTAPGLQAKDRKWRRVLCILEGTMLKVYKCPSGPGGVSAIEQWWEKKVGAGDVAVQAAMPNGPGVRPRPTPANNDRNLEEEKALHHYQSEGPPVASVVLDQAPPEPEPQRAGPSSSSIRGKDYSQIALSKSALNIAVNLLKPPVGKHSRSHSHDNGAPPSPRSSRPGTRGSSFDVSRSPTPAPSSRSSATLASRSHSPMPSASSSVPTPYGSESSMASGSSPPSSSNLAPPSSRSGASFGTPPSSARSRFRSATTSRTQSSTSASNKTKDDIPEPSPDDLIRIYTLQNAESGLGNDYVKRKNVIRVRLEGEQFLLQAPDVSSVVEWIEGLQAATNIALDLDARPMPRGPIFPRRRRRRRPQIPPISTNNVPAASQRSATETYTPQSATAGQPALRRS